MHAILIVLLVLLLAVVAIYTGLVLWLIRILQVSPIKSHLSYEQKVIQLQRLFKQHLDENSDKPICTSRTQNDSMTTRNTNLAYKSKANKLDIEQFNQIIEINQKESYVHVETRLTIGELLETLVPLHLTVPVVPELRTLTIGGLITGAGIESSSHIYGLFLHSCMEYEVLNGAGERLILTAKSNPEMFSAVPFSSGSLCLLLSVKLKLIPCKTYVKIEYIPVNSNVEAVSQIAHYSGCNLQLEGTPTQYDNSPAAEYVEGILFTPQRGLIIIANQCESYEVEPTKLHTVHWYSQFWHHFVKQNYWQHNNNNSVGHNYMSLLDYYFRHDRGTFWTVERKFPISLSLPFRLFFGFLLDSRLRKLKFLSDRSNAQEVSRELKRVVQDPIVPLKNAVAALNCADNLFGIAPIWLCPFKLLDFPNNSKSLLNFQPNLRFYLDIGLYAAPTVPDYSPLHSHRALELFLRENHGFLAPYAVNYSTSAEFWVYYNKDLYQVMRQKFQAEGKLVGIYDKIGGGEKVREFDRESQGNINLGSKLGNYWLKSPEFLSAEQDAGAVAKKEKQLEGIGQEKSGKGLQLENGIKHRKVVAFA
jgi:hypothetical protein